MRVWTAALLAALVVAAPAAAAPWAHHHHHCKRAHHHRCRRRRVRMVPAVPSRPPGPATAPAGTPPSPAGAPAAEEWPAHEPSPAEWVLIEREIEAEGEPPAEPEGPEECIVDGEEQPTAACAGADG